MIEIRKLIRENGEEVFQFRMIPLQIGWIKNEDKPVIQPQEPISFNMSKNWTPWEDIETVKESDINQEKITRNK